MTDAEVTRLLLVKTILEASRHGGISGWSLQGLGMFRLYLSHEKRLHVWDARFRTSDVSVIHTHPWHFTSEVDEYGDRPRWVAMLWCVDCGRPLVLTNHTIAADGQVTPSVGHPENYPPCSWHPTPRLIGWVSEPDPEPRPIAAPCEQCGAKSRQLGGWGTWSGGAGLICPFCVAGRVAMCGPRSE